MDHLPEAFAALEGLVILHITEQGFYFGKYVPNSLPVPPSRFNAGIILYSALIIDYAIMACHSKSDTGFVQHSIDMATTCWEAMIGQYRKHSQGPYNTAIQSADRAIRFLRHSTARDKLHREYKARQTIKT